MQACVLNVTGMTLFLIDIAVEYVALSVIVEEKRKYECKVYV